MKKIAMIVIALAVMGHFFAPASGIDKGAVLDSYADCYASALADFDVSGPDDYADNKNPHVTDWVETCVYNVYRREFNYARIQDEHFIEGLR